MKNANVFVDFDLTLLDANGRLLDGAREALEAVKRAGCRLFLWSNASVEFLRVTHGDVTEDERQRVQRQLRQYCALHTEGMIWIVNALRELAG